MAARRLVIIMLVLLGVSALLAALLPEPNRDRDGDRGGTTSTATEAEAETPTFEPATTAEATGQSCAAELQIGATKPFVVPLRLGDRLTLTINPEPGMVPDLLEIEGLGLIDPISEDKPVVFDLYGDLKGSYGVRLVEADRPIGRVVVEKRETCTEEKS